jgi:hypothetical protein
LDEIVLAANGSGKKKRASECIGKIVCVLLLRFLPMIVQLFSLLSLLCTHTHNIPKWSELICNFHANALESFERAIEWHYGNVRVKNFNL